MSKRRVKLPGRFAEDDNWYVVRFLDKEISCPLKQSDIEDFDTGETGLEKSFDLKDRVQAPWIDGVMYEGVIEFKSERKEECLKYKETEMKEMKTKKKNKGQKSERKQKTQKESQKMPEDSNIDLLKKKKKENNEKKKKTESARQHTSIEEAEELFRKSLTSHVSLDNNSNVVTDDPNTSFINVTSVSLSENSLESGASHTVASESASAHTFPSQSASSHTFPSQSASSHTFPSQSASSHTFPSQSASSHTFPSQPAPSHTFPSQSASSHTFPSQSAPSHTFPSQPAPPHTFPSQSALSCTFPSQSTPSRTFPSQSAPSHTFSSQSAPSHTLSSQSAPSHTFPTGMSTTSFPSTCTYSNTSSISSLVSQSVAYSNPFPRPSYEAISPGKFSPSSEACYPNSYFSGMSSRFSSPFSPYPPVLYPFYGHRYPNSVLSPLPEDSTRSIHSMELLHTGSNKNSDPLPVSPCESPVSVELDVCNDSPRNSINTAQSPEISEPRPTSFLSSLSDNGCGECILKDNELQSSREFQQQLENDIIYWKTKAKVLQAELDSIKGPEAMGKTVSDTVSFHYKPKRGTVVETCPYVFSESLDTVPRGFVRLVEGHDLFVDSKWIGTIKGLFRGKTKSHCFKLMMNGFYEPEDFLKKTAMLILQTPLGQALKGYAVTILGLDNVEIVKAINSKIGTMSRAVKQNRVVRE